MMRRLLTGKGERVAADRTPEGRGAGRRRFLRSAALAGGAAGIASAVAWGGRESGDRGTARGEREAAGSRPASARYRMTPHVARYYQTARR